MTLEEFKSTLGHSLPPEEVNACLQALWYDANGDWEKAHEIVQDLPTRNAARVHAYLHRKEGDRSNASYWYHRAGTTLPSLSLNEEWEQIVQDELGAKTQ